MQPHGHVVQLFDTLDSRADAVSTFAREGLLAGDVSLLIVTPPTWEATRRRCHEQGVDVDAACAAGWLTVCDAKEMLAQLMHLDEPHWPSFERLVLASLRPLEAAGAPVRIYGEMVDVLVRAGEFAAAARLEEFWNRLQTRESFLLFCGYSAEHFGNPRDSEALRGICRLHAHVRSDPRDVLGNFLLKTHDAC